MEQSYAEANVKKKTTGSVIALKIILIILVILVFLAAILISISTKINLLVLIGVAAIFGLIWYWPRFRVEWEYVFCDGQLDFDMIQGGERRKNILRIEIEDADVKAYTDEMLTEYQTYANMYGMEMEEFLQSQMGVTEEQLREAYRETATFRVKMTLAFHAIAEQEGLTVSDEEYQDRLSTLASQYGYDDPSQIEQVYDPELIKEQIIQEKAIDLIAENGKEISE